MQNARENAGEDAAVVLNAVKAGKGAYGYNASNGEFGNMLEAGILDPTKVTRLALQNAAWAPAWAIWTCKRRRLLVHCLIKKPRRETAGASCCTRVNAV